MIVITAAILMVVGVGINLAWLLWWPSWPGVAIVQMESPMLQEALAAKQLPPAPLLEMFARAEASRIRSRKYANLVLQHPNVTSTEWAEKHR